jgi:hypothetical protein
MTPFFSPGCLSRTSSLNTRRISLSERLGYRSFVFNKVVETPSHHLKIPFYDISTVGEGSEELWVVGGPAVGAEPNLHGWPGLRWGV